MVQKIVGVYSSCAISLFLHLVTVVCVLFFVLLIALFVENWENCLININFTFVRSQYGCVAKAGLLREQGPHLVYHFSVSQPLSLVG